MCEVPCAKWNLESTNWNMKLKNYRLKTEKRLVLGVTGASFCRNSTGFSSIHNVAFKWHGIDLEDEWIIKAMPFGEFKVDNMLYSISFIDARLQKSLIRRALPTFRYLLRHTAHAVWWHDTFTTLYDSLRYPSPASRFSNGKMRKWSEFND